MSSNENADPAQIGMRIRGANGQTANLFVVEVYGGTDKFVIDSDGDVTAAGNFTFTGSMAYTGEMAVTGDTAAAITLKVAGASGQTADLFVVEQNDGTDVFKVDKDGYVTKQFDPDAASYIVWKSGSTYYAKNGATGAILSSGSVPETVIQAAITALTSGGTILIRAGTYTTVAATGALLTVASSGICIAGEGRATVLDGIGLKFTSTYCGARDLRIIGNLPARAAVDVALGANHFLGENIVATVTNLGTIYATNTFLIDCGAGTLTDVTLRDCVADGGMTFGFNIYGTGTMQRIWLDNCRAIDCGKSARVNDWIVGFDICEAPTLTEDVRLTNCIAEGCWESGFHVEYNPVKSNVSLHHCMARENGLDKTSPTYGSGFIATSGMTLVDCESYGNDLMGFRGVVTTSDELRFENCRDIGSPKGFYLSKSGTPTGKTYYQDCVSRGNTGSGSAGFYVDDASNVFFTNPRVHHAAGAGTGAIMYFGGAVQNIYIDGGHIHNLSGGACVSFSGATVKPLVMKNMTIDTVGASAVVCTGGNAGQLLVTNVEVFDSQTVPTLVTPFVGADDYSSYPLIDTDTVKVRNLASGSPFYRCKYVRNRGTATISAGSTYVDVTHLLHLTPTDNGIQIRPYENLGGRDVTVGTIGSTTFRITMSSSDTIAHNFFWDARLNNLTAVI